MDANTFPAATLVFLGQGEEREQLLFKKKFGGEAVWILNVTASRSLILEPCLNPFFGDLFLKQNRLFLNPLNAC